MKHVSNYFDYMYEGKSHHTYRLKVDKKFNIFDLLSDLKEVGAEILDNSQGKTKDEVVINVALDEPNKSKIEDKIKTHAELLED